MIFLKCYLHFLYSLRVFDAKLTSKTSNISSNMINIIIQSWYFEILLKRNDFQRMLLLLNQINHLPNINQSHFPLHYIGNSISFKNHKNRL